LVEHFAFPFYWLTIGGIGMLWFFVLVLKPVFPTDFGHFSEWVFESFSALEGPTSVVVLSSRFCFACLTQRFFF